MQILFLMHQFVMGDALKLNKRPVSPRHALLKRTTVCTYVEGGEERNIRVLTANLSSRQDFPTPESPMSSSLKR